MVLVNKLCAFVASETNPKLIYYFLQKPDFAEQFTAMEPKLIVGVSIKNLTEINFPLPPPEKQQRIVALLEKLFADLDKAKVLLSSKARNFGGGYPKLLSANVQSFVAPNPACLSIVGTAFANANQKTDDRNFRRSRN